MAKRNDSKSWVRPCDSSSNTTTKRDADTAAFLYPDGIGHFSIIIGIKNSETSYPNQGYYATLVVTKPGKEPRALAMGRPRPDRCNAVPSLLVVLAAEVNVGK